MDTFEDKRRHFRFPAFDDVEGVKLNEGEGRVLFENEYDNVFKKETASGFDMTRRTSPGRYHDIPENITLESKPGTFDENKLQKRKEEDTSRKALLNYQGPPIKKTFKEMNKPMFRQGYVSCLEKKKARESGEPLREQRYIPAHQQKHQPTKRFVPTHIPKSMIPDDHKEHVSKTDLLASMKKNEKNYLLIDDSDQPFKEHPIQKKYVSPKRSQKTEVPFAKRETHELDEKKNPKMKESSHRLEKSLSGIMEEAVAQPVQNKYFEQFK